MQGDKHKDGDPPFYSAVVALLVILLGESHWT